MRAGSRALLLLLIAGSVCSAGCQVLLLAGGAAAGAGAVIWHEGRLEQNLDAPLAQTVQAAEDALEALGLPVLESKADKLTAHLESEYADGKHVWIDMEALSEATTRARIRVGVMGDKERALNVLDAIKDRL